MIEPLRIAFEIDCAPDHAFTTWTRRASAWWPPEHTVSHEAGAEIVFEPHAGGRIFERTEKGREIEWGRELSDSTTRVEIEHGGWDRLPEVGEAWRNVNQAGWDGVLPAYRRHASTRSVA